MTTMDKHSIETILDLCLDRVLKGHETIEMILDDYPTQEEALRPRLEAALWLTAQKPNTEPRPEFVQASSQRLMASIQREAQIQRQKRRSQPSFWENLFSSKKFVFQLTLIAILVFSSLILSSTLAFASQNTLPGEALYSVKTSLENARLVFTFSPTKTAQLHIQYADRRLMEIQILSAANNYDNFDTAIMNMSQHITQALEVIQSESAKDATQTVKLAQEVHHSLSRQEQTLAYLKSIAPSKNQAAIQQAVEISSQALGIAEDAIEAGSPTQVATGTSTSTDTPVIKLTDTPFPSTTVESMAQPSLALMASETLEPTQLVLATATTKVKNTPKPTNPNRPTQKPTKPPKPTKTPKPDKPTKPPKN